MRLGLPPPRFMMPPPASAMSPRSSISDRVPQSVISRRPNAERSMLTAVPFRPVARSVPLPGGVPHRRPLVCPARRTRFRARALRALASVSARSAVRPSAATGSAAFSVNHRTNGNLRARPRKRAPAPPRRRASAPEQLRRPVQPGRNQPPHKVGLWSAAGPVTDRRRRTSVSAAPPARPRRRCRPSRRRCRAAA